MNQKKTINFVLGESGLQSIPSLYDYSNKNLNSKELIELSTNIREYIGLEEQKVFNQMILDLPSLDARLIVKSIIRLDAINPQNGWYWNKKNLNHDLLIKPPCSETEQTRKEFIEKMGLN